MPREGPRPKRRTKFSIAMKLRKGSTCRQKRIEPQDNLSAYEACVFGDENTHAFGRGNGGEGIRKGINLD